MIEEDVEPAGDEPTAEVCNLREASGALERLAAHTARLGRLIASGELEQSLRQVMLVNPVRHGQHSLAAQEADVVERIGRHARPTPLSHVGKDHVCLSRLARAGFLVVDRGLVQLTPKGRALAVARRRQRRASKRELYAVCNALARSVTCLERQESGAPGRQRTDG
jgi:hypothetical protein